MFTCTTITIGWRNRDRSPAKTRRSSWHALRESHTLSLKYFHISINLDSEKYKYKVMFITSKALKFGGFWAAAGDFWMWCVWSPVSVPAILEVCSELARKRGLNQPEINHIFLTFFLSDSTLTWYNSCTYISFRAISFRTHRISSE